MTARRRGPRPVVIDVEPRKRCVDCGAYLVNTSATAACCPRGHGRVVPRVSAYVSAKGAASPPLPLARRVEELSAPAHPPYRTRSVWAVQGHVGLYRQIAKRRRGLKKDSSLLAQAGERVLELTRWAEVDQALTSAGYCVPPWGAAK